MHVREIVWRKTYGVAVVRSSFYLQRDEFQDAMLEGQARSDCD